jgi:hypothetical protein
MKDFDLIYLNKGGNESDTRGWVYYRTTATTGLGIGAGEEGSTVRVCRVTCPHSQTPKTLSTRRVRSRTTPPIGTLSVLLHSGESTMSKAF